jgi:hypothetical protein
MASLPDDEALVRKSIAGYLEDFPKLLSESRYHHDAGGARGVQPYALKVEGVAASIGGEAIPALASRMQEAGKVGGPGLVAAARTRWDTSLKACGEP